MHEVCLRGFGVAIGVCVDGSYVCTRILSFNGSYLFLAEISHPEMCY